MQIKPLFETGTIELVNTRKFTETKLSTPVIYDPKGELPNGIYKVIRWEKQRQIATFTFGTLLLLASAIVMIINSTVFEAKWYTFIFPLVAILLTSWKLFNTFNEKQALKKGVQLYKENLSHEIENVPVFMSKMYIKFHTNQVAHNWFTIATLFYGGILTIILWWLKDVNWTIFEFDKWIQDWVVYPNVVMWSLVAGLLTISVMHIVMAVHRKKRIMEMDAFFGERLVPTADVVAKTEADNKMYRRIFVVSVLVILVIPYIVKAILRIVRGQGIK